MVKAAKKGIRKWLETTLGGRARRGRPSELPWWCIGLAPSEDALAAILAVLVESAEVNALAELRGAHPLKPILADLDLANPGAVTPTTIIALWNVLDAAKPATILEMGAGISTTLFAHYARTQELLGNRVPHVYSVEHAPQWVEIVSRRLRDQNLHSYVSFIRASVAGAERGASIGGYQDVSLAEVLPAGAVDLCLIDGPPAVEQPLARMGCLPIVSKVLRNNAIVFLDDAAREGERAVMRSWRQTYSRQMRNVRILATSKGLASFRWVTEGAGGN